MIPALFFRLYSGKLQSVPLSNIDVSKCENFISLGKNLSDEIRVPIPPSRA